MPTAGRRKHHSKHAAHLRTVLDPGNAELALLGKVSDLLVQGKTENAFGGVVQQAFHSRCVRAHVSAFFSG